MADHCLWSLDGQLGCFDGLSRIQTILTTQEMVVHTALQGPATRIWESLDYQSLGNGAI